MKSLPIALAAAALFLASARANADGPVDPKSPYNAYLSVQLETTAGVCPANIVVQGTDIVGSGITPRSISGTWSIAYSDGTATDKQPFQANGQGIFTTPILSKTATTAGPLTAIFSLYDPSGTNVVAHVSKTLAIGCGGAPTPTPIPPATWGVQVGAVQKTTTCPADIAFTPQGVSAPARIETGQWSLQFSDGSATGKQNFRTDATGALVPPAVTHSFTNGSSASATMTVWDASGAQRGTGASQTIKVACSGAAVPAASASPGLGNHPSNSPLHAELLPCADGDTTRRVNVACAALTFGSIDVGTLPVRDGVRLALLVAQTKPINTVCSSPLSFVVKNIGSAAAEPANGVSIEAYVDGKEAALSGGYTLAAGASVSVGPLDLETPAGAHDVTIVIDPKNVVRESDRKNTTVAFHYTLAKCGP
jgi:hypothetical protein